MEPSLAKFGCITELAEALKGEYEGECVSLHGETLMFSLQSFAQIPVKYIRLAMWPMRPAKRKGTDKWPLFSLAAINYPATVCSISGNGTTLLDGTLEMLEHACIVFDECRNVIFSGITFTGGLVVCRGTNCNMTFNACNFDGCKLVAMDGAQVHLVDSLLEASLSQIGLLARGEGTAVDAQNCIIMNGIQSASAQEGAAITLQDCSCSGASVVGVEVRGEGSRIQIKGSFVGDMKGAGQVTSAPTTPTVAAAGGATPTGSTIRSPLSPGIWSTETPTAASPSVTKPRAHSGAGVPSKLTPGSSKSITMFGPSASATTAAAAACGGQTHARGSSTTSRATASQLHRGGGAGSTGTATTTTAPQSSCSSSSTTAATSTTAMAASAAAAAATPWTGKSVRTRYHASNPPKGAGPGASTGANAAAAGGRTPHGPRTPPQRGSAAVARAPGLRITAGGTPKTPGTAETAGALSSNNASRSSSTFSETPMSATANNANLGSTPRGSGADHTPTSATAMLSFKTQQPFHGPAVTAAATLMQHGTFQTKRREKPMDEATAACGILVHSGSAIAIETSTVKRCLYGVWIDRAELRAQGCEFVECGGSCMEVKHAGCAMLRQCTLSGAMRKHGIGVHGSKSTAQLKGCKLQNNKESGALVTKTAKLSAEGCQTGGNNAGFWAQEQGILTITQCLSNRDIAGAGASSGGTLTADGLTAERSTGDGVRVFNAGVAELKKCALLRCSQDGAWVNGSGSMLRIDATGIRENARFGVLVEKGGDVTCEGVKSWGNKEGGFGCAARSFMSLRRCISRKETAYEVDPSAKMLFEVCQPSSNKGFFKRRA